MNFNNIISASCSIWLCNSLAVALAGEAVSYPISITDVDTSLSGECKLLVTNPDGGYTEKDIALKEGVFEGLRLRCFLNGNEAPTARSISMSAEIPDDVIQCHSGPSGGDIGNFTAPIIQSSLRNRNLSCKFLIAPQPFKTFIQIGPKGTSD